MKLSQIFSAIFFVIILHLTLFISGSTIQRSLSDDIRSGINMAGKILGVDSPTNIAVISNIAELVTRAFSKPANEQNGSDRRQFMEKRPIGNLEDFGDNPHYHLDGHTGDSGEQITDKNVIVENNINTETTTTTGIDHGFLGNILRIMGMDSSKMGALAINGIIFIAQMIGRSFLSAFTSMTKIGGKPNDNINVSERGRRFSDDTEKEYEKAASIWGNTVGWIVEQSKSNPYLTQQIETMLERDLPERIIRMVDNGNNVNEESSKKNTDCIKQLLCKTAPFIWSMQKAISTKINESEIELKEADDPVANDGKSDSADNDYHTKAFYKYLPSVDEFTHHGVTCENQYTECKLF